MARPPSAVLPDLFYNRTYTQISGSGAPPVVYTRVIYYSSINQIPAAAASAAISPTAASAVYGRQPMERSHQFNITLQRDVGFSTVVDVAYVGNFDRHALEITAVNPVLLYAYANPASLNNNTELTANLVRQAYPGMGAITYTSYSGSAVNYNGLQASANHRLTRGVAFGVSYTFSKAIGSQGRDPYYNERQWYYGPLPQDRTHLFSWNFAYNLPGKQIHWKPVRAVFDNWTLSGIGIATTGAPANPSCSSTAAFPYNDPSLTGVGAITQTPSTTSILGYRCQEAGDPSKYTHDFYNNYNTSAFAFPATETFGNTGLSILRQPAWWNFDASLDKRISLGESAALRLRFQAFKVFNHTEFTRSGRRIYSMAPA